MVHGTLKEYEYEYTPLVKCIYTPSCLYIMNVTNKWLRMGGSVYEGENYCSSLLTGPLMAGDNLLIASKTAALMNAVRQLK